MAVVEEGRNLFSSWIRHGSELATSKGKSLQTSVCWINCLGKDSISRLSTVTVYLGALLSQSWIGVCFLPLGPWKNACCFSWRHLPYLWVCSPNLVSSSHVPFLSVPLKVVHPVPHLRPISPFDGWNMENRTALLFPQCYLTNTEITSKNKKEIYRKVIFF